MSADTELIYTDVRGLDIPDNDMERLSLMIPSYFREKAGKSKKRDLKIQRLAAGLMLAYTLKSRGLMPAQTPIITGAQGKPEFKGSEGFCFNISHSAGLVLLAVSEEEVGCDIQKVSGCGEKIAERFFTAAENEILMRTDEHGKAAMFTRIWARKESYIKAVGEGMKRDLRSFSVLEDTVGDGFYFADFDLEGYAAAVCFRKREGDVKSPPSSPELRFHPFQSLVDVI